MDIVTNADVVLYYKAKIQLWLGGGEPVMAFLHLEN